MNASLPSLSAVRHRVRHGPSCWQSCSTLMASFDTKAGIRTRPPASRNHGRIGGKKCMCISFETFLVKYLTNANSRLRTPFSSLLRHCISSMNHQLSLPGLKRPTRDVTHRNLRHPIWELSHCQYIWHHGTAGPVP